MSLMSDSSFGSSNSLIAIVKSNSLERLQYFLSSANNGSNLNVSYDYSGNNETSIQTSDAICTVNLDLEERDSRGCTALHLASIRGTDDIMRLLLEKGADVSALDLHGNTPLHYCGHIETIQCLLDFGADIYARNFNSDRALELLKRRGVETEAIELLENLENSDEFQNDDVTEPLLKGQRRIRRLFNGKRFAPIHSLWYEFYLSMGVEKLCLILFVILCLSLYVAYAVTGMSESDRVPVEVEATKVEL